MVDIHSLFHVSPILFQQIFIKMLFFFYLCRLVFRFQHFITDSNLLIIRNSPLLYDYFPAILSLISRFLNQDVPVETARLLMRWCKEIILESKPYLQLLLPTQEYENFLSALISCGRYRFSGEIVNEVCSCLLLITNDSGQILEVTKLDFT